MQAEITKDDEYVASADVVADLHESSTAFMKVKILLRELLILEPPFSRGHLDFSDHEKLSLRVVRCLLLLLLLSFLIYYEILKKIIIII